MASQPVSYFYFYFLKLLVSYFEYSLDVGIWMEDLPDQFMPAVFYELVL